MIKQSVSVLLYSLFYSFTLLNVLPLQAGVDASSSSSPFKKNNKKKEARDVGAMKWKCNAGQPRRIFSFPLLLPLPRSKALKAKS